MRWRAAVHGLPQPLELPRDLRGSGPAVAGPGGDGGLGREMGQDGGVQPGVERLQVLRAKLAELDAALLAVLHQEAGDLVRDGEGHAVAGQPVGRLGRERETFRGLTPQLRDIHPQRPHQPGQRGQHDLQRVDRVEGASLVFAQIPIVREGQAFEQGQQRQPSRR